jgi:hypothetical protein
MHGRDDFLPTALRPLFVSDGAVMRMTEPVCRLGHEHRRIKGLSGCAPKTYPEADERASRRRRYGVWQVDDGITRP